MLIEIKNIGNFYSKVKLNYYYYIISLCSIFSVNMIYKYVFCNTFYLSFSDLRYVTYKIYKVRKSIVYQVEYVDLSA